MTARLALIATLLLTCCLTGCIIPRDRDIAQRIEKTINAQLHPEHVSVALRRNSIFSTKVKTLDITISGFTADHLPFAASPAAVSLPAGAMGFSGAQGKTADRLVRIVDTRLRCEKFTVQQLPVQMMEITLHEMRIPMAAARAGQLSIHSAESAGGHVVLNEEGMTKYLRTRALPIDDVSVRVTPQGCTVRGTTRGLIKTPVAVSGRLVVRNQAVLYLDKPTIEVLGVSLPKALTEKLLADLNPIADLNADFGLPVPLTITKVQHQRKTMRFSATLHFPQPEMK